MLGDFVCLNGKFIKIEDAEISLDNIEFSYGFGVYENIRFRNEVIYFVFEHVQRLFNSAKIIGLKHNFEIKAVIEYIRETIRKNKVESANIKILLIGGIEPQLYIMLLAPLYPDKKIYHEGVKVIPYIYERFLPEAKTLNMLPSYLAYSEAKKEQAYDAIFVNYKDYALEGTRSNLFALKNKTLYTAPVKDVLDGVTRRTVIDCANKNGYKLVEKKIKYQDLIKYEGIFLTNTSGKIVPVRQIGKRKFEFICEDTKKLINCYGDYLEQYGRKKISFKARS